MLAGHADHKWDIVMIATMRTWALTPALMLSLPGGTGALAAGSGGSSGGGGAASREPRALISELRYEEVRVCVEERLHRFTGR